MNPNVDPNSMMHLLYQQKVEQTQRLMLKQSIKVLRQDFGFSPEMIHEFVECLEKEMIRRGKPDAR